MTDAYQLNYSLALIPLLMFYWLMNILLEISWQNCCGGASWWTSIIKIENVRELDRTETSGSNGSLFWKDRKKAIQAPTNNQRNGIQKLAQHYATGQRPKWVVDAGWRRGRYKQWERRETGCSWEQHYQEENSSQSHNNKHSINTLTKQTRFRALKI